MSDAIAARIFYENLNYPRTLPYGDYRTEHRRSLAASATLVITGSGCVLYTTEKSLRDQVEQCVYPTRRQTPISCSKNATIIKNLNAANSTRNKAAIAKAMAAADAHEAEETYMAIAAIKDYASDFRSVRLSEGDLKCSTLKILQLGKLTITSGKARATFVHVIVGNTSLQGWVSQGHVQPAGFELTHRPHR